MEARDVTPHSENPTLNTPARHPEICQDGHIQTETLGKRNWKVEREIQPERKPALASAGAISWGSTGPRLPVRYLSMARGCHLRSLHSGMRLGSLRSCMRPAARSVGGLDSTPTGPACPLSGQEVAA